jgi:hypothetical protein
MNYLTKIALILFLFNTAAVAQISVSVSGNNASQVFTVAGKKVNLGQDSFLNSASVLSGDINSITGISTVLKADEVGIYSIGSEQLYSSDISTAPGDESLKIYTGLNGSFIIRENIANFLFYDARADIAQSVSNSSQSTEGESISELAADPAFKTIVLYNPKIVRDGIEGSRARFVESNYTTEDFFYSSDRAIRSVKISNDGQFIGVISFGSGDDQLSLFDRFGNELNTISFDQSIMDFEFSTNRNFVTIRSNGRVGVYNILSGERIGSTSFRSRLYFATFVSEENTIVAMTAESRGNRLSDIEFHAINIEQRTIERQEFDGQLGVSSKVPVTLQRNSAYRYRLEGFNNPVDIRIQF